MAEELVLIAAIAAIAFVLWRRMTIPQITRGIAETFTTARREFELAWREASSPGRQMSAEEALMRIASELGITTQWKTSQQISEEILRKAKENL